MNITDPQARMQHLYGPFWWASSEVFLKPGLWFGYLFRGRVIQFRLLFIPHRISQPVIAEFPEQTVVIAKDQPEYLPLPAHRRKDSAVGEIVCCWRLTFLARLKLLFTGRLWHSVWTFNQPLQPQRLMHTKPEMKLS